jgi:hypothetical protein
MQEEMRDAISEQVGKDLAYLTDKKDPYVKIEFWGDIEQKLLRGNYSDFSFYARMFVEPIVKEVLDVDALLEHALTSPHSIGDYWLRQKEKHVVFGARLDLRDFWGIFE